MSKAVFRTLILGAALASASYQAVADGWDPSTRASNVGSIANTRHNLTVSYAPFRSFMDSYFNNYGDVCVYCHTPHGSSSLSAPLWNHTKPSGAFDVYSRPTTLSQPVTQPGPNSLTCLSCHDGTISIDSIINMPGSGGYRQAQESSVDSGFLSTWANTQHLTLQGCTDTCHDNAAGQLPSFEAFLIGKDLNNDHPIGVLYPTNFGANVDFKPPNGEVAGRMRFFDKNGNSRLDTNEVRTYQTGGDGFEVECASCHDPHGVPSGGAGSQFIPSFLRVSNAQSALCLTCHDK